MRNALTSKQITDLMVSAIEGGSSYWCKDLFPEKIPENLKAIWYAEASVWAHKDLALTLNTHEDEKGLVITREHMREGARLLQKNYPKRWASVRAEDFDAEDADVFFQLCVFKDVRYG